jgi:hypothetical protein
MASNLNIESASPLEKKIEITGPETTLPKDGGILLNSGVSEKCSAYFVTDVGFVAAHDSEYISNSSRYEEHAACGTWLGNQRCGLISQDIRNPR